MRGPGIGSEVGKRKLGLMGMGLMGHGLMTRRPGNTLVVWE